MPDTAIVARLGAEDTLLLTHDEDFLDAALTRSAVIVSRVTQTLPLNRRLEIWHQAIGEYFAREWSERVFEVYDNGQLVPWKIVRG